MPPHRAAGTVVREELINTVDEARATPIVVLNAGPGWGKTTLLAQWASRSRRRFAWVSVDDSDNDPVVLLTYIAVAVDRVSQLEPGVFDALAAPGASVQGKVVPRLGASLAGLRERFVLVLDDLHLLHNPVCLDAITALAKHVPDGSQLALSARGGPALSLLGSLRANRLAVEVGHEALRMDEAEARQLLSAAGVEVSDDQLAELVDHTEGWCAGLYLAALADRARGPKPESPPAFLGSDRLVSDYLRSEVLEHLSPGDLRFLTRTSVLHRMSGPLCEEVLEASDSTATLESLARSNLFLVALDRTGEWYRYHHLFQELLRSELARAEPDLIPRLLARASRWCEQNGQPEAAIAYAQEAGDVERVAGLFEFCAMPAYVSGRATTAERWLAWLDARGALERNAAVAVLGAVLAALWGRPAEAHRWAEAAGRATYEGTLPDGTPSIDAWRSFLSALLCSKGPKAMRTDAARAVGGIAPASPFHASALVFVAVSHWLMGEIDTADDLFADAAEESLEVGSFEAAAAALGERAAISIGREMWVEAEELTNRALLIIHRSRMDEYPGSAFVYAVAARVALHRADAQRAQELLALAQRLRPQLTYAVPYLSVQTRLELARAYLKLADTGGAETMLREIEALLRRRPDLGTLPSQVEDLRAGLKTMRAKAPGTSSLTEAELRLLPYLATHLSFREVGERLFLSRHTVKSHAMAVYRKLGVTSRNAAVGRAGELGLL